MQTHVETRELKRARDPEEFRLHCAALEWSLAEPIIINSAEDIKSRVDWQGRVEPFLHQVQNLMRFCRRLPVTLLADDVGLGKTISAGLIVSELMKRNRVHKVFVICPGILVPQWVEELDAKFGIKAYGATGAALRGAANRSEPVIVTTYQSATRHLNEGRAAAFDMLILDEAHKVRNLHGKNNPPQMATAVFKALESRTFKYVLMLTATPIQNRLWDIYSLVDCLAVARGHRNPFGSPDQFALKYIADSRQEARVLNARNGDEFRKIVGSYMFRTRRKDAKLAFPEREVKTYAVSAGREEQRLQEEVAASISKFGALQQSSLLVAMMSSPQALAAQLENMRQRGTAPQALAAAVRSLAERVPRPSKAEHVLKIADLLRGQRDDWRMVIFTRLLETQRMLGEVLDAEGISFGFIQGGNADGNRRTVQAFRKEPPDIHVVVSTDAGAEGVNLQAANVLVNYDLPWNPMIVEQRIGRVQRIGSRFKKVWVANVVHKDSPEERIVGRLMEKLQVISHTVGDIEAVLAAANDDEGSKLEGRIREMVIEALRGQDPDEAARLAGESIEKARALLEEQQHEMDAALGDLEGADEMDIPMPELERVSPAIPLEEFVLAALRKEGARVEDAGDGLYTGQDRNRQSIQVTFDPQVLEQHSRPGVFHGRVPDLYLPGKPAFERLVQRWKDRSELHSEDLTSSEADVLDVARAWVGSIPNASFVRGATKPAGHVSGSLSCLTRVGNAVDSYEKVVPYSFRVEIDGANALLADAAALHPGSLLADVENTVRAAVGNDPDLQKFHEFYQRRLENELGKTDADDRRKKLEDDLRPQATTEVAALEYVTEGACVAEVVYRLQGSAEYTSRIEVDNGAVAAEPARLPCAITGREVPVDCLATCEVTGQRAIRELMAVSEAGGGLALPEKSYVCEVTGQRILETEAERCCITGKIALSEALVESEMSGRVVIPTRAPTCEITGARVADDELVQSVVSGKWFRADQAVPLVGGEGVAHSSEATRCEFSGAHYPASECTVSAYSGKAIARARVVRSEESGRECDESELQACAESGLKALPDELVACGVSGDCVLEKLLAVCSETGVRAKASLFVECEETGEKVLPAGLGECCLTGKRVRKSLLAVSAASGKTAMRSLMRRCEKTGALLLPDELARSEVSGATVDKRILRSCAESGRKALPDELVQCAVSGDWILKELSAVCPECGLRARASLFATCEETQEKVLPAGLGECSLSGKRVRKSLLAQSEASGKRALRDLMRRCEVSDALLLPRELARSEISGTLADRRLLRLCAVSGTAGLKTELVKSAVSGKWFLPAHTVTLADGQPAGQQEASLCQWTQKYCPTQKTGVCSLSHIRVHAKLLNASGELSPLRDVLDGKHAGKDFAEPELLARECPDAFGSVRACKYVRSFSQQAYILFGTKSFFGFGQKVFAVVALTDATGIHLAGRAMTGKRRGEGWVAEDFVEVGRGGLH